MEPTPQDVAAVAAFNNGGQPPAPVAAPPEPQQQPTPPTPQPTPSSQPAAPTEPTDPFAAFATVEPTPPAQPTEPTPTPPTETPVEPSQPITPAPAVAAPTAAPAAEDYQTFDEYMAEALKGVPQAPAMPDASKINPDDPLAIKQFFDDIVSTAVAQAKTEIQKGTVIQTRERQLWDAAFDKYGSLRTNKKLRDMVHGIRMSNFNRGIAITPTQAADNLLEALGQQYKQGVADNQVITTIEDVQPNGGGSGAPVVTTADKEAVLTAVQTGGETALASYLDGEIKAGKL